jgi:uncharacterized membrane protein
MTKGYLALSEDVPTAAVVLALGLLAASLALLVLELVRRERHGVLIAVTGVVSTLAVAGAVLRPVRVEASGNLVGPRVVVLVDQSRRMLLPAGDEDRHQRALAALQDVERRFADARVGVLGFSSGPPRLWSPSDPKANRPSAKTGAGSDVLGALDALSESTGERPRAIVLLSDGRLTRPSAEADEATLRRAMNELGVPLHTVSLVDQAPADASIRAVRAAGAAVAHQPLALEIDVGCTGGLSCGELPVVVSELRHGVAPAELARGVAKLEDGSATVELSIILERAGSRVVEIALGVPKGDTIAGNDKRTLTFSVARDRVRLLHVAGRPTYDVRALRMWLKSDQSIDLVAFFILRTLEDDTLTRDDAELALIPFPVDELFTQHLASFDAVVLQDIDAVTYRLERYLPNLRAYVEAGGGLIMVGGPSSFSGGNYAGTAVEAVLPVSLPRVEPVSDAQTFVPEYTPAGRAARVLHGLRELLGEELPEMPGANLLGPRHDNSIVLWEHASRRSGDAKMPVLAVGESGDGRSIALGVDGTHLFAFSELAVHSAGRAYGALWEGLLGWLMRDPRYESARVELVGECVAEEPVTLRVVQLPGSGGEVTLELVRLGVGEPPLVRARPLGEDGSADFVVDGLKSGGYTARVRLGQSPPTRFDFACEKGGDAWADSRPDPARLERLSAASGGVAVGRSGIARLPAPRATEVQSARKVSPLAPPWAWAAVAAFGLGGHWLLRRRGGLA